VWSNHFMCSNHREGRVNESQWRRYGNEFWLRHSQTKRIACFKSASKVKFSSQIRSDNHHVSLAWNVKFITDFRLKSLVPNYDQIRCWFGKTCTKFMATPKEREHMKELVWRVDGRMILKCVLKNSVNLQAESFLQQFDTNIFIVCRDHSTVKIILFWLKFG
jgi:hypothetical protein